MNRLVGSLAISLIWLGGCGGPNAISDVQIRSAPGLSGTERMAVCDVCGAASPCGLVASTTNWAVDHYHATGRQHKTFTRKDCRSALGENWGMGVRPPPTREIRSLDEQRRAADRALTPGMRVNQAYLAIGNEGVVEAETAASKTIRFRQSVTDGVKTSWRDLWADFSVETGQLVSVRHGPWSP